MRCSEQMIEDALDERLEDDRLRQFRNHLSDCDRCRARLDEATADAQWWRDATRFLDESILSDPDADRSDCSASDARLFDDDDPVGELRAIGAIQSTAHPEMLGMLGRYTVEREIGSGGMGVVLKAHDAELSRTVAIKVLAPHLARSGAARQRFIREGRAAAAVVHENVVAIHEVDSSGKLPSLVMRYVDGISLQRHVDLYGPLSVHDALRIGSQTAAGLAAAHRQGIIHRDVKPANILINHTCSRAWISDFGLARAVDDASLTRTGFIAGTPHYMSPEQARGSNVGPASDLFSLGAVLYFMFAARPPWRAERSLAVLHRIVHHEQRPLWQINSDIPREISDLVDRLLQKQVVDRPSVATEIQEQLEHSLSHLQNPGLIKVNAESASETKPRWWTRPWFVAPLAAGLTACAFLLPDVISSSGRFAVLPVEIREQVPDSSNVTDVWNPDPEYAREANPRKRIPPKSSNTTAFADYAVRTAKKKPKRNVGTSTSPSPANDKAGRSSFGTPASIGRPSGSVSPVFPAPSLVLPPAISIPSERGTTAGRRTTNGQSATHAPSTFQSTRNVISQQGSTIPEKIWVELSEVEALINQVESDARSNTPGQTDWQPHYQEY